MRIRPTCGPFPCVTTTSHPSTATSAIVSAARRAAAYISSYVSSAPRRSSALPPRAITTRSIAAAPRPIARLQDRSQDVLELRRVRQHVEVVANPDGRLRDRDDA